MNIDSEKYEDIYSNIEKNFKHKFFDFNYPKNKKNLKWQYYEVLSQYLKNNGYGYLHKRIEAFIEKKDINDIELSKLLMDCNLINRPNKSIESEIRDKSVIEYKRSEGLSKTYKVKYSNTMLLSLDNVVYSNGYFISHKIDNNKKEIDININIQPGKSVNFTEIISIYTNYGIDKLEFTLKSDEIDVKGIDLKNIAQFLELCKNNKNQASEIFLKNNFKDWLLDKEDVNQIINYTQAINIYGKDEDAFNVFCKLNGIFIGDSTKVDIDLLEKSSHSDQGIEKDKILDAMKEIVKDDLVKSDDINIDNSFSGYEKTNKDCNDENKDNDALEAKKKPILGGLKKVIGSLLRKR